MTELVYYRQNDTIPIGATLPVELVDANTVTFELGEDGEHISAPATITDESAGTVIYEWDTGETDRVGKYEMSWVVEWDNGSTETFPKLGYDILDFQPD